MGGIQEWNSAKHASTDELAFRVGDAKRSHDYAASMDFGSFDGSCTSEVRSIVENAILISLCKTAHCYSADGVFDKTAIEDRLETELRMEAGLGKLLTAVVTDAIQQSGDRALRCLTGWTYIHLKPILPNTLFKTPIIWVYRVFSGP